MTAILAPQDLPQGNAQFVAYGPAVRVAHPNGGNPITVRPQTYVRYYSEIKVKEIVDGGRNGGDTVAVHFDPESVGLKEPITAYLDPDDPVLPLLRAALDADQPVAVALETVRRAKTKDSKTAISPLVPIHALRGAKDPAGGKASMEVSGQNIRNIVAMVNGRQSKVTVSDPSEWAVLSTNKTGDLPPEGWKHFALGNDWTEIGAIIADADAPQKAASPAAAGIDPAALKALVTEAVAAVVGTPDSQPAPEGYGRPVIRGRFDEGKKWDVRANDGKINLGSYLASNAGWVYRWAFDHLTTVLEGETPEDEVVWGLTEAVLAIGDKVQADAYGHGVEADRVAPSHTIAVQWVEWAVEKHDLPFPLNGEGDAVAQWATQVAAVATPVLAGTGRVVGEYLTAKSKAAKPQPAQPANAEPSGPSKPLVDALLATLARTWTNLASIGNIGAQVVERKMEAVEIGVTDADADAPTFTYPPAEGSQTVALKPLLENRWRALKRAQDAAAGHETQAPTEAPTEAPTVDGYEGPLGTLVGDLSSAGSLEAVRAVYAKARDADLLNQQVWAKPTPDGGVVLGSPNEAGFAARALVMVLDRLRKHYEQAPAAPVETEAENSPEAEEKPAEPEPQDATPATENEPEPETEDSDADAPEVTEAQALADKADKALADKDKAALEAIVKEADEKGLNAVVVKSGSQQGPLSSLVKNRLSKLRRQS